MTFILASNNAHKAEEFRRILSPMGHRVQTLAEAGITADPEETGDTFAANALLKAKAVQALCGQCAVLADDSGLMVDALAGAPGVHSARFAGGHGDSAANNAKLLRLLAEVPQEKRTARFICALALLLPSGRLLAVEGSCEGAIGFAPKGEGGFGYDPLFYRGETSLAQMTDTEKDAVSHRGSALHRLTQALPDFLAEEPPAGV